MNIPVMGMIGTTARPALPPVLNADWMAWAVQGVLLNGTMRGLFTMLFGAGMLLMLRRAEGDGAQVTPIDVWLRRCLALMALGVVNWLVLLWPGEILWNYGLVGFVLLAFRRMRPRGLFIAGALCLSLMTVTDTIGYYHTTQERERGAQAAALQSAGKPLSAEQRSALSAYRAVQDHLHPTKKAVEAERQQRTHWTGLIGWSWDEWSKINISDLGWTLVLESLIFMLFGMGLFRAGVLTGQASTRTYLHLIFWGYLGGLGLRLLNLYLGWRIGFGVPSTADTIWNAVLPYGDFEPARLLMTLGHLGLVVLLFRSGVLGKAVVLRALGRMALTTYLAQSVITSVLFYGFGLVGRFGFAELMLISVGIWIVTGAFCVWWLKRHEMGPAEALLRTVAYDSFRPGKSRREAKAALSITPAI
ncbi:MAG: DUF418 domain-containing protein [Caulobacteraceae bacterium]